MKASVIAVILFISMQMIAQEVYDFSPESKPGDWIVIDDGVMGGNSRPAESGRNRIAEYHPECPSQIK